MIACSVFGLATA